MIQYFVIANPENRRVLFFQQALERFKLAPARVIPYMDLLNGAISLDEILGEAVDNLKPNHRLLLRIESPGENFEVEKRLIARGAASLGAVAGSSPAASRISTSAALRLHYDRGRIRYPAQWFAGFKNLLAEIDGCLQRYQQVQPTNSPSDISLMFDKPRCHRLLNDHDLRVPTTLENVQGYDDLRERMDRLGWKRAFVKLAYGSSASGVVALYLDQTHARALTTLEMVGSGPRTKFYNNLKLSVYHRHQQIRRAIDYLCGETAQVERWLPKQTMNGRQFDLRVLTVGGKAQHVVVRTSKNPITNLHLGNKRGDLASLQRKMGSEKWQSVLETAERAACLLPQSLCIGLDILLKPGFREPTILEINAFGDLLPGAYHDGLSTHEAQVSAMNNRSHRMINRSTT